MSIAFFDVDGTLLPHPSLERRCARELLRARQIPAGSVWRWLHETLKCAWRNFPSALQTNKDYLCGVESSALRRDFEIPDFFPEALQRVWWHARCGDQIVLVTGTLKPLAQEVSTRLQRELRWRGVETEIAVIATALEYERGRLTGRILGLPMFGEEKAKAISSFAKGHEIPLSGCYAYGDHGLDRWMLSVVDNPFAVNPSASLRRLAHTQGWPIVSWRPGKELRNARRHAWNWKGETAR